MINYSQVLEVSKIFGNPIIRQKGKDNYCVWIIKGQIDYFKANLISHNVVPEEILKEGGYFIDAFSRNKQSHQSDVWIKVSKKSVDNLTELYRQMSLHQRKSYLLSKAHIHTNTFMDSFKAIPFCPFY